MRTLEVILRNLSIIMLMGLGVLLLSSINEAKDYTEYSTLFVVLFLILGIIYLGFGLYGAYKEIKNILKK